MSIENLDTNEIVFPKLGIDLHLDSTCFSIGSLEVQWYGVLITAGLLLALIYGFSQLKHYGLHPERFLDCIIAGIIGGVVGARTYYVLMQWDEYKDDLKSIFYIREGGLAIYGGIIGALLFGCIMAKIRKVKILPLLDVVSIGFLLGQGIGRWGNFFNQEAFGCNTDSIFGMSGGRIQYWLDNYYESTNYYLNSGVEISSAQTVHPCFLYESVWCLLGFVLLALFAKKIRKYDGQIFLIYIRWYGLERAFVEGLRADSLVLGNIRISQLIAILCVVASVILQIVVGSRVKRMGVDYKLYKDTPECAAFLAYCDSIAEEKNKNKTASEEETPEEAESVEEKISEESEIPDEPESVEESEEVQEAQAESEEAEQSVENKIQEES